MALLEQTKTLHEKQIKHAVQTFDIFKEKYIIDEFVNQFGVSYERPVDYKRKDENGKPVKDWRKEFDYTPEREKFLINKTTTFINIISPVQEITDSPVFFKNLLNRIAEYLSVYICRKNGKPDRNISVYVKQIYEVLNNNIHINKEQKRYKNKHFQEHKKRVQEAQEKRKKAKQKNLTASVRVEATYSLEAENRLLKRKIYEKNKEIRHTSKELTQKIDQKRKEMGLPVSTRHSQQQVQLLSIVIDQKIYQ